MSSFNARLMTRALAQEPDMSAAPVPRAVVVDSAVGGVTGLKSGPWRQRGAMIAQLEQQPSNGLSPLISAAQTA